MIKVQIQCVEKVRYCQTVEMTKKQWEELKKTKTSKLEDSQMSPLTQYLDLHDPMDAEGFEDVEMEVVDEEGKSVEPADYYQY